MIEIITPSSRDEWLQERKQSIGASEVAALLGVHPYLTAFELHAIKSGKISKDPYDTPAMRRGRLLEAVAVSVIAEENPTWEVDPNPIPGGRHYRDTERRLSCTPDLFIRRPDHDGTTNVQIKSVHASAFRSDWKDNGEITPPMHATVQAIMEAHLTGAATAAVAALVVDRGVDLHIIDVPVHQGIIARVQQRAEEFWAMIAKGEEPEPDWARDGDVIERMFSSDDGSEADLSGNKRADQIVLERNALAASIKEAEEHKKTLDTEMKSLMGNHAAAVLADGRRVTWKSQTRREHIVRESSFRVLRYPS